LGRCDVAQAHCNTCRRTIPHAGITESCFLEYTGVPNSGNAIISVDKIRDYLLSLLHPVGRYKALFFKGIGYSSAVLDLLIDDFRKIITENDFEKEINRGNAA